jgi:L-asparaginase II
MGEARMGIVKVEVTRGDRVESVHTVAAAILGADGAEIVAAGDVAGPVFTRSAIKPFQALPLVEDGVVERFGLTGAELALCCASHGGEREHVDAARSILRKAGLDESALACGPHAPFHGPSARALEAAGAEPGRIHNNCSGKHAGMLALARAHGWPAEGYHAPGHPVQERVAAVLGEWMDVEPASLPRGVDGCGVVTFAVPLRAVALGFARLAAAPVGSAAARVLGAMGDHPHMVAGSGRLCTRLAEETGGSIVAKVGAEGVYTAALRVPEWGLALKVLDGARRAAEVALVGLLDHLDVLSAVARRALGPDLRPVVRNTRGETVGEMRVVVDAFSVEDVMATIGGRGG